MDRRARTPRIALTASDWEIIDRAAVEADLPGILQAYGWRAVHGKDSAHQRVLTDSEGSRRIMISRHPENHRWQWWDAAIMVVGTIVEAVTQLLGFRLLRDAIVLLRDALISPPDLLPVLADVDRDEVVTRADALPGHEPLHHSEEKRREHSAYVFEVDHAADDARSEQPTESGGEPVACDAEIANEQPTAEEEIAEVQVPEDSFIKPPRAGGRGR